MSIARAIALLIGIVSAGCLSQPALSAAEALGDRGSAAAPTPTGKPARVAQAQAVTITAAPLAQTVPVPSATDELLPTDETAAPSVLWLIAMPAVPLVGGALIYLSRRWFGRASGECRLVAHVAPPDSPMSDDNLPQDDE